MGVGTRAFCFRVFTRNFSSSTAEKISSKKFRVFTRNVISGNFSSKFTRFFSSKKSEYKISTSQNEKKKTWYEPQVPIPSLRFPPGGPAPPSGERARDEGGGEK